jgi:hypothetical protein
MLLNNHNNHKNIEKPKNGALQAAWFFLNKKQKNERLGGVSGFLSWSRHSRESAAYSGIYKYKKKLSRVLSCWKGVREAAGYPGNRYSGGIHDFFRKKKDIT